VIPRLWVDKTLLQIIPARTIKNQFAEMGFAVISSDLLEFCGIPFRFFLHRVPWQAVLFSFAGLACAPSLSKKPCFAGHEPPAGLAFCGLRPLAVPRTRAQKDGGLNQPAVAPSIH
jgi:hypothetical protein|tara:strand:- start:510 stop:857 length:348 start_codon:yes stop_codon:yes gene_type:complete